jgi:predicted Rossmann-fold nucleotide-binding protein
MHREYWEGLFGWLSTETAGRGYIDLGDLDLLEIVDNPAEIVAKVDRWQHLKGHDSD